MGFEHTKKKSYGILTSSAFVGKKKKTLVMAPAELIRKTDDGQVKSKQTSTCHLHTDPGEHGRSNPKTVCVCVCVPLA